MGWKERLFLLRGIQKGTRKEMEGSISVTRETVSAKSSGQRSSGRGYTASLPVGFSGGSTDAQSCLALGRAGLECLIRSYFV